MTTELTFPSPLGVLIYKYTELTLDTLKATLVSVSSRSSYL